MVTPTDGMTEKSAAKEDAKRFGKMITVIGRLAGRRDFVIGV